MPSCRRSVPPTHFNTEVVMSGEKKHLSQPLSLSTRQPPLLDRPSCPGRARWPQARQCSSRQHPKPRGSDDDKRDNEGGCRAPPACYLRWGGWGRWPKSTQPLSQTASAMWPYQNVHAAVPSNVLDSAAKKSRPNTPPTAPLVNPAKENICSLSQTSSQVGK